MKTSRSGLTAALLASCFFGALPALAADSIRLITDAAVSSGSAVQRLEPLAATAALSVPSIAKTQPGPDAIELAALYYYADQKQEKRLEAEAERLRLKYPDFIVPADVYLPASARGADEEALWTLFEKDDLAGIEAEIVRRRTWMPDWNPTADFAEKLARKRQRLAITQAAGAKDWMSVAAVGAALDPKTETDADLLWALIDAYAETGATEKLPPLYQGILFRDPAHKLSDDIILTTLQKATRDFPSEDIRAVMRGFSGNIGLQAGMSAVSLDLIRRDMGAFNADETRLEPLPESDVKRLRDVAEAQPKPADLSLIGWYYFKLKQPSESMLWFRRALTAQRNPDNAKGLYLSLAAQNLDKEAFEVATEYLEDLADDPEFLMNALSLRFARPELAAIDAKIVASYSSTILQTLNGDHGEILAWYAYNSRQFEAAEAWFAKSFEWEPEETRLKGLALSYLRLGSKQAFAELEEAYGDLYPDIWTDIRTARPPRGKRASVVIEKPRVVTEAASYSRHLGSRNLGACIADLKAVSAQRTLSPAEQLASGWCHLGLLRAGEARSAFAVALKGTGKVRTDAAYGMALTLLRGQLTDEAENILGMYPMNAAREKEIRSEIYVQRARSAFEKKQYERALDALNLRLKLVAEPNDLTQLRGWSHYHLGNKTTAHEIFARLKMRFNDPALQGGAHASSTF